MAPLPRRVLLSVGFDVVRDDSQFDGLQLDGLGTPVRSEIGPTSRWRNSSQDA